MSADRVHELLTATALGQAQRVRERSVTAVELTRIYLERIARLDGELGCYLAIAPDAEAQAAAIDAAIDAGHRPGPLAGVPIALKDNLVTAGLATTAGSKILAGWEPPYDGTAVARLRAAGAVILGKLNCDEFGMGSSTENSAYQPTRNPWNVAHVPGGSSGGAAAAVAAGLCAAALGTDTGGSIRQPAAFCGVTGLKPTYGRVSRFGVIAYASSLDQVGPITATVADAALLCEVIAGHDPLDATSLDAPVPPLVTAAIAPVAGLRIGRPREYYEAELDPEIRAALDATAAALVEAGATLVDVTLPHTRAALAAYYVIAPAEASSNLSRYDGVRFGPRAGGNASLLELYRQSRGVGFGPEVKRRIMLGTYALRAGYYEAYYQKAQQVRALVARDFEQAFTTCDVLLTPAAPTTAFRFGARATPLEMYLGDAYTLGANLAGIPGLAVPCAHSAAGLPIGAQLLGRPLDEATLIAVGSEIARRRTVSPWSPYVARNP